MCVTKSIIAAAAVAASGLLMAGCYIGPGYVAWPVFRPGIAVEDEVFVQSEPPALPEEVVTVSPGPAYVWLGGYWHWGHRGWIWAGGHWSLRPHFGAVWVAPIWVHRPHGWVFIHGHWR
jgi:hypothetical protein